MLRRQSICSSVHVKDWLSFPWNQNSWSVIDESLSWSKHIEEITKKITVGISALKRLRDFASRDVLFSLYNALIMPHFDYCCEVWDSLGSTLAERL